MFKGFCFVVFAFCAVPAFAAEKVYYCEATHKSRWGFVTPEVVFFLDDGAGKVRVLDGIVQSIEGGPTEGSLQKRSEDIRVIQWDLENIKTSRGTVDGRFKAYLNVKNQTYSVRVTLSGTGSDPRGEGKCKIVER